MFDIIMKMTNGNPGALTALSKIVKADEVEKLEEAFMTLLALDDMNIRESQIWIAYKYLFEEDAEQFIEAARKRDKDMVDFINQENAAVGNEMAVTGGASFDRSQNPDKYRMTEKDVEEFKKQKEERDEKLQRQAEEAAKNNPASKKREEKKKQTLYERLKSLGRISLGELEHELTKLQEKEAQAKELSEQYEAQLPDENEKTQEEL